MDQSSLESTLADLHLPAIRFFPSIGSTNTEAWKWIDRGAPNQALIIADAQTAGRGRFHRRWFTATGTGLAFSLVLLSPPFDPLLISRLTGLGAVAVQQALVKEYSLPALIKWPNDILLNGCKASGVLVEARWSGETLLAAVIGIGINIAPESVSEENLPVKMLNFPATCIETVLGEPVDRQELLHATLRELLTRLPVLSNPGFIREWESGLAFRGHWVEVFHENALSSTQQGPNHANVERGKVIGLTQDGSLQLMSCSGRIITAAVGELQLRPPMQDDYSCHPIDLEEEHHV